MHKGLEKKLDKLRESIRKMDSVLVTYSGNIDSTFLLRICREELGEKAVAVTAFPPSYPEDELNIAKHIASIVGAKHIALNEREIKHIMEDAEDIHFALKELAATLKLKNVLDHSHMGDLKSEKFQAARKSGLKSPLIEAGLTRADIRLLAKYLGLPTQDKIKKKKTKTRGRTSRTKRKTTKKKK